MENPQLPSLSDNPTVPTHSLLAAVIVPAAQAIITGLVLGIFTLSMAWSLSEAEWWPAWLRPLALAALVATGSLAAAWLYLLGDWRRLVRRLEIATGQDLDGDGEIGAPLPPEPIRVEVVQEGGHQVQYLDLPITQDKARDLAIGLLAGRLSEESWTGAGGPFSRADFRRFRDTLIQRGLARWINPAARAQGYELTSAGRAVLKRLASPTPSIK